MSDNKLIKKIIIGLSAVGPGLFLIGYNIGTGSVTTMAKTGAEYGMSLFWALVLSCIFTYILMIAYGKVTLVTGNTALFNFKNEFKGGWALSIYIIIALIIGELLALMGVMGIVADLIQEGVRLAFGGAIIHTAWIILFLASFIYLFIWRGNYQLFEKVLTVLVILMGLSFIVVFFMVKPSFYALRPLTRLWLQRLKKSTHSLKRLRKRVDDVIDSLRTTQSMALPRPPFIKRLKILPIKCVARTMRLSVPCSSLIVSSMPRIQRRY